jgi:hypothetical protein
MYVASLAFITFLVIKTTPAQPGCCIYRDSEWTLYEYYYWQGGDHMMMQQEISSYDTLAECIAAFNDEHRYHESKIESGKCVHDRGFFLSLEMKK